LTSKEIEPTLAKVDIDRIATDKKRNTVIDTAATAKAKVHIDAATALDKSTADARTK